MVYSFFFLLESSFYNFSLTLIFLFIFSFLIIFSFTMCFLFFYFFYSVLHYSSNIAMIMQRFQKYCNKTFSFYLLFFFILLFSYIHRSNYSNNLQWHCNILVIILKMSQQCCCKLLCCILYKILSNYLNLPDYNISLHEHWKE